MEFYLLVKWAHVLSSTILFGFGAGTAWYWGLAQDCWCGRPPAASIVPE
jgi:uncharacterized membrane protein